MKRLFLILLLIFPLSCYDGLSDMLDDLTMKVPICVDASAEPGGDGRGWRNAFQTLQEAVAAAEDGDEIWVAEGNYYVYDTPANGPGVIEISQGISIYGGFSGRESRRDARNSSVHITKILADGATRLISFSTAVGVIIDGFTIDGGYAAQTAIDISNSSGILIINCVLENSYTSISHANSEVGYVNCMFNAISSDESGAAISANASLITIKNSVFDGCSSTSSGGAIYANNQSTITIIDTHFYRNNSPFGGAIHVTGAGTTLSVKDTIFGDKNVVFSGNRAATGGAIYASNVSEVNLANTQFYRNSIGADGNPSGSEGGAIYVSGIQTSLKIQGSVFGDKDIVGSGNGVTGQGGAIYVINSNGDGKGVTISDNTQFYRNTSTNQGGAIYLNASTLNVTNSSFGGDSFVTGNKSTGSAGGAICAMNNSDVTMSEAKIKYNSSSNSSAGGGIFVSGGSLILNSRTYIQNNEAPGQGGGIYAEMALVNISDSYLQKNYSATAGGGMRFSRSIVTIINTEISQNSTGSSGTGGGISYNNNVDSGKTLTIQRSRFIGNSSGVNSSVGGGAIQFSSTVSDNNLNLIETDFDSNLITGTGGGGAIYFSSSGSGSKISMESCRVMNTPTERGAAVYALNGSSNLFVNTLFYNNNHESTSAFGGALWLGTSSLLVNLTFFNNKAQSGGAIYLSAGNHYIYNCVFYNNCSDNAVNHNVLISSGTLNSFNCFYYAGITSSGHTSNGDYVGNLSDPFLNSSDPSNSNFMHPGSLLLDSGFTGAISGFTMPATDLAGNPRNVGGIDIGAYERQ